MKKIALVSSMAALFVTAFALTSCCRDYNNCDPCAPVCSPKPICCPQPVCKPACPPEPCCY